MRALIFGVCTLLVVSGCSDQEPNPEDSNDAPSAEITPNESLLIRYPERGRIQLGAGVGAFSMEPTNTVCVRAAKVSQRMKTNDLSFQRLSDYSSFSETLNISAQAKASTLYGDGEASASYASSRKFSQKDTNISARGLVMENEVFLVPLASGFPDLVSAEQAYELPEGTTVDSFASMSAVHQQSLGDESITLTEQAQEALKGDDGLLAFREMCGDYFVSAIRYGGSFDAILTAKDTTESESKEITGNVSGSFPIGNLSIAARQTMQSFESRNRLDINVRSEGVGLDAFPISVSDFLNFVETFPAKAAGNERPLEIVLTPYNSLPGMDKNYNPRVDELDRITDQYLRLQYLSDNVGDALLNPDQFVLREGEADNSLAALGDEISEEISILASAVGECRLNIDTCSFPEEASATDYEFRSRMPLHKSLWPWESELDRNLNAKQRYEAEISRTPATNREYVERGSDEAGLPPRVIVTPNPRYRELQGILRGTYACLEELQPQIERKFVHDRHRIMVVRAYSNRKEQSLRDRQAYSFEKAKELLLRTLQNLGLPVEPPSPITSCKIKD